MNGSFIAVLFPNVEKNPLHHFNFPLKKWNIQLFTAILLERFWRKILLLFQVSTRKLRARRRLALYSLLRVRVARFSKSNLKKPKFKLYSKSIIFNRGWGMPSIENSCTGKRTSRSLNRSPNFWTPFPGTFAPEKWTSFMQSFATSERRSERRSFERRSLKVWATVNGYDFFKPK